MADRSVAGVDKLKGESSVLRLQNPRPVEARVASWKVRLPGSVEIQAGLLDAMARPSRHASNGLIVGNNGCANVNNNNLTNSNGFRCCLR